MNYATHQVGASRRQSCRSVRRLAPVQAANPANAPTSTVVVGGGPTGLATAIMLARRGWKGVEVWERYPRPATPEATTWGDASRSYNLGVSDRGQKVLARLGVLDRVLQFSQEIDGAMSWTPGKPEPARTVQPRSSSTVYSTQVIQRDRITSCLLQEIEERYADAISVRFETVASVVEFGNDAVKLRRAAASDQAVTDEADVTVDFVIGADGGGSALRKALAEVTPNVREVTLPENPKNSYVYKTVTLALPNDPVNWPLHLNYKARSPAARVLECLPTKEGNMVCTLLFKAADKEVLDLKSTDDTAAFFKKEFPGLAHLVPPSDLESFPSKSVSRLPIFRYTGPHLHYRNQAVLLGDACHIVKPYFGLGLNSALEDVIILSDTLDESEDRTAVALPRFTEERASDSRALVEMSHRLDQGFFAFVFPLIIDGIFNKLAPWLFSPNVIRMMQDASKRYTYTQRKKRVDRVFQVAFVAALGSLLVTVLRKAALWMIAAWRSMPPGVAPA